MSVVDERHAKIMKKEGAERSPGSPVTLQARDSAAGLSGKPRDSSTDGMRAVVVGNKTLYFPETPPPPPGVIYTASKRLSDIIIASALLLILLPVFVLIAVAVFVQDGGDIFYYQTRVGKDERHFRFYKFRSMVRNADEIKAQLEAHNEASGPIFKMKNDPRITSVGRILRRSSFDELPQLLNVLRGEMSLIGPRPHLPREVALYEDYQRDRLSVQPGLLCFREVYGRSNMTFMQWIELDLLYIQHRSFATDMRIVLRTIPAILKAEGAY